MYCLSHNSIMTMEERIRHLKQVLNWETYRDKIRDREIS